MGSDESHFNVSVGSNGQNHKTLPTNHNLSEEKGEPKRYRTEVLLRGDKECPVSGVTSSGRGWSRVPESDAQSVCSSAIVLRCCCCCCRFFVCVCVCVFKAVDHTVACRSWSVATPRILLA